MVSFDIPGRRGRGCSGFSLVEVLLVVLIMGILAGVVGSLMMGFVSNFEITDDQSIARRRAQDVFNILQVPILSAGLGLPTDDGTSGSAPVNNGHYFGPVGGRSAPISGWYGPVQVIANTFTGRGDALRLIYSIPSGVKHVSSEDVTIFSGNPSGEKSAVLNVTSPLAGGYEGLTVAVGGTVNSVHSYITFPGTRMHPVLVTGTGSGTINVTGMTPRTEAIPSEDVMGKGAIRPFHDIYFVRAGVAYVDDESRFCFADITDTDISGGTLPKVSALQRAAYRVEGITAMRVVTEVADNAVSSVTVFVVAEGDSNITGRKNSSSSPSQEFRAKYPGTVFEPEMYYEEFQMRWRTRNIESPERNP
jgi:prepilin-type N-terminal cleavage/methylation domain-containing protein